MPRFEGPAGHGGAVTAGDDTEAPARAPTGNATAGAGRRRGPILIAVLLASGLAALGYEMIWTWMLSGSLGHEYVSALAVVGAFFGGISLGAWGFDGPIRRSAHPVRWYAGLEAAIGLWALVSIVAFPAFSGLVALAIGPEPSALRHWGGAFLSTFLLLLPATAAMGATLPAVERIFSALRRDGWHVGVLYGANTFGAVCGTVLATFLLAPALGFAFSLALLAALNFVCAGAVLLALRGVPPAATAAPAGASSSALAPSSRYLTVVLLLTGFAGLAYEVLVVRVLSQVLENTVYTFAAILSVYLLGTAAGAIACQRLAPRDRFRAPLHAMLVSLCLACLLGVGLLEIVDEVNGTMRIVFGSGRGVAALGEGLVALLVFGLPTLLMGATFSHLAQAAREQYGLGRALAVNTLGGALAPLVGGLVLLPLLGSRDALALVAGLYLLPLIGAGRAPRFLRAAGFAAAAAVLAVVLLPGALRHVTVPPGGEVVAYSEGVMASIAVVSDTREHRYLKVDNHFTMGGTATGFADRRQAHVPLLLHPQPRRALFLGLGTGATFAGALVHPELQATAVELLPELLPLLGYFGPGADDFRARGFEVLTGDARRYVRTVRDDYDVIVAEVFHPSRDGAGALYTVEHFEAIRARLRDGGLFCQWLPLFQLDLPTLRTIMRTFASVFPRSEAWLAHYSLGQPVLGLVGREAPQRHDDGWVARRLGDDRLAQELRRQRLADDFALLGNFLASDEQLRRFAGDGPLNTDDHPVVVFQAPDFLYGEDVGPPVERLLALVDGLEGQAQGLVDPRGGEVTAARLAAYWRARDAFLRAGAGVAPSNDIRRMVAQVREPLLAAVRLSPDFSPAYDPLLAMAAQLHRVDAAAADELLRDLHEANPQRTEALRLRRQLSQR